MYNRKSSKHTLKLWNNNKRPIIVLLKVYSFHVFYYTNKSIFCNNNDLLFNKISTLKFSLTYYLNFNRAMQCEEEEVNPQMLLLFGPNSKTD